MSKSLQPKKKRKWLLPTLIGLLVIMLVAVFLKGKQKPKGKEVEYGEVQTKTIHETVSGSGKIYPQTEVKISSDVSGEVVELYVKEGDSVKVGQILAKIDPEAYVSAVERGRASVNSSKSQLSMSQSQIENSKAQSEQIRSQLENARSIHKRNEQLRKDGIISAMELDQSLSNVKVLESNLRAAEAGIKSAVKNAESSGYAIKSSEANLKELQTSLSRTIIKAPMSGIISSLPIEKGERVVGTIQMTGTEMMRISNLQKMEVQVQINENDIPKVKLGDKVDIDVDAYGTKVFKGSVVEIANSAANISSQAVTNTDQVTNFTVKISIDPSSYSDLIKSDNKYPFRPGMSASVDIFTNEVANVIAVPIQSVTVREKDNNKKDKEKLTDEDYEEVVFVISGDTLQKARVVTGIQDDEFIEIKSGLSPKQAIVIGPYTEISKNLKQGEKVYKKVEKKEDTKKKKK